MMFFLGYLIVAGVVVVSSCRAMRSTPKPDRLRSERQEESEVEESAEVAA